MTVRIEEHTQTKEKNYNTNKQNLGLNCSATTRGVINDRTSGKGGKGKPKLERVAIKNFQVNKLVEPGKQTTS